MGVGGALIMPATLSIIANVFPREERGKAIGIWAGMAAVGIGLGPLAGGLLLEWFDWSVGVPPQRPGRARSRCCSASASCPRAATRSPGAFDFPGAVLSIAGFSRRSSTRSSRRPRRGWTSAHDPRPARRRARAARARSCAGSCARADPMLDLGFFRNPRFSIGTARGQRRVLLAVRRRSSRSRSTCSSRTATRRSRPGAIMTPLALGLVMGAGSSSRAVERLGTGAGRRPPG